MATQSKPSEPRRPAPRLYLVTPPTADPARLAEGIADALGAADVAAVLVPLTGDDERALLNGLKVLAPAVQNAGVALLLDGRPELVARAGADGAHLAGIEDFGAAVVPLKPERSSGGGGPSPRPPTMGAVAARRALVTVGEPGARRG